jgi:hypothetical protein
MCVEFKHCYNFMFCSNLTYTFHAGCFIKSGENMLQKLLAGIMFQSLYRNHEEISRPMAGGNTNMM